MVQHARAATTTRNHQAHAPQDASRGSKNNSEHAERTHQRRTDTPAQRVSTVALALPSLDGVPGSIACGDNHYFIRLARAMLEEGLLKPVSPVQDEDIGGYIERSFKARVDELQNLSTFTAFSFNLHRNDFVQIITFTFKFEFDAHATSITELAAICDPVHPNFLPSIINYLGSNNEIWTPTATYYHLEACHCDGDYDWYIKQAAKTLAKEKGLTLTMLTPEEIVAFANYEILTPQILIDSIPKPYYTLHKNKPLSRKKMLEISQTLPESISESDQKRICQLVEIALEIFKIRLPLPSINWLRQQNGAPPDYAIIGFIDGNNFLDQEMFEESAEADMEDTLTPVWGIELEDENGEPNVKNIQTAATYLTSKTKAVQLLNTALNIIDSFRTDALIER